MAYHLSDHQWTIIEPLIHQKKRMEPRGRPRQPDRPLLNGILWILKTGAQWSELPREYPPYQSCHRRFQEWVDRGVFDQILELLARDMESRGKIALQECFIDGTFAPAKKGAAVLVRLNAEKAVKSWLSQTTALFLSPSIWPLLLRTKSRWLQERLPHDLLKRYQAYLWVIGPTTVTNSTRNLLRR